MNIDTDYKMDDLALIKHLNNGGDRRGAWCLGGF